MTLEDTRPFPWPGPGEEGQGKAASCSRDRSAPGPPPRLEEGDTGLPARPASAGACVLRPRKRALWAALHSGAAARLGSSGKEGLAGPLGTRQPVQVFGEGTGLGGDPTDRDRVVSERHPHLMASRCRVLSHDSDFLWVP